LNERLSASSQRQALNALVFLYREVFQQPLGDFSEYRRAKARTHLPVWLTKEELQRLFACLDGEERLMARVMYGAGLRLMELLRLRVKDLDLQQEVITVRGGKGDRDRFAPLAHCLVEVLQQHLQGVRQLYELDRKDGVAAVWLPDGLERKYPHAGLEWPWFWVWPERTLSVDPRQGLVRRHHVLDRTFQVAIKSAASKAGLNKRVTPHVLRHTSQRTAWKKVTTFALSRNCWGITMWKPPRFTRTCCSGRGWGCAVPWRRSEAALDWAEAIFG